MHWCISPWDIWVACIISMICNAIWWLSLWGKSEEKRSYFILLFVQSYIIYKQLTMFWQLWFSVHSLILLLEILCVQKYLACLLLMFFANMNMFFCCTIAILHFLSSKCMLLDLVALTNEEHWCFLPNQSSDVVDILIVLLSLLLGLPLLHSCATIILDDHITRRW